MAQGWHRQRGRFRGDLVGGVYGPADFTRRGLPAEHGVGTVLCGDAQEVAYWRATASGWVIGLALRAVPGGFEERLYAGPAAPGGLPTEAGPAWALAGDTPPDWA